MNAPKTPEQPGNAARIDTSPQAVARLVENLREAAPEIHICYSGDIKQAAATLTALLARCEKAESDATNYRARMVEVEAERDNLRARLEAAEASCKEWVEAVRAVAAERSALLARLDAVESARNEREPRLWDCEQRLAAAQAEVARLQAGGCARDQRTTQYCAIAVDAQAQADDLRARLETANKAIATLHEQDSGKVGLLHTTLNLLTAAQARVQELEIELEFEKPRGFAWEAVFTALCETQAYKPTLDGDRQTGTQHAVAMVRWLSDRAGMRHDFIAREARLREALYAADDDIREHLQVARYNLTGTTHTGDKCPIPNPPQLIHAAGIAASEAVRAKIRAALAQSQEVGP